MQSQVFFASPFSITLFVQKITRANTHPCLRNPSTLRSRGDYTNRIIVRLVKKWLVECLVMMAMQLSRSCYVELTGFVTGGKLLS